ncbi:cytochrome c [Actimicrobium sp. CCC2.4]|uniref:c-type cytochrome n=1 Tax=Actimicrobium sp. CCC2.4 TaxID=3048606 RepID=UPI002AC8FAB7|nr:cytochrome c [Actimicrobium sp. CCC2.4]MEB0135300.1 cytochrome c [Actimicrobium sp. CCC2.4]WPX31090.1 cytochrome c [Actimicrobium sp. CCC2.4]
MALPITLRSTLLTAGLALTVFCHQNALGTTTAPDKAASTKLYTVVDKNKVDPNTLIGWKVWRAQSCSRCHGAAQEGLVGPSLIDSMKVLTKEQFVTTLKKGRIEKGMPNFGGVPFVADHLDELYAYLKGRSEGDIAAGRLQVIVK